MEGSEIDGEDLDDGDAEGMLGADDGDAEGVLGADGGDAEGVLGADGGDAEGVLGTDGDEGGIELCLGEGEDGGAVVRCFGPQAATSVANRPIIINWLILRISYLGLLTDIVL